LAKSEDRRLAIDRPLHGTPQQVRRGVRRSGAPESHQPDFTSAPRPRDDAGRRLRSISQAARPVATLVSRGGLRTTRCATCPCGIWRSLRASPSRVLGHAEWLPASGHLRRRVTDTGRYRMARFVRLLRARSETGHSRARDKVRSGDRPRRSCAPSTRQYRSGARGQRGSGRLTAGLWMRFYVTSMTFAGGACGCPAAAVRSAPGARPRNATTMNER
jgi:hypothetical protein